MPATILLSATLYLLTVYLLLTLAQRGQKMAQTPSKDVVQSGLRITAESSQASGLR